MTQRLRNIAGVDITRQEETALKKLSCDRNALQHYGLAHQALVVEARAGQVLDFLSASSTTSYCPASN